MVLCTYTQFYDDVYRKSDLIIVSLISVIALNCLLVGVLKTSAIKSDATYTQKEFSERAVFWLT